MTSAAAVALLLGAAHVPTSGASAPMDRAARARDEAGLVRIKTELWPGFYRNQDVEGLGAFLANSFVNIAPDGTTTPRAEELAAVRTRPWNPRNFRYQIDRIVWLDPDLVLVIGRGTSDRTDEDGGSCRHLYVSSNLLRRAPTAALGWQALSSHVSGEGCAPS